MAGRMTNHPIANLYEVTYLKTLLTCQRETKGSAHLSITPDNSNISDIVSVMSEAPVPGPLLRQRRQELKWTLDDLATRSGVSRSMVSQIERSETNPTFATLWNLTQALNIDFSDLTTPATTPPKSSIETTPADRTPLIQADENRVSLRILNPPSLSGQTEWYELVFQPDGHLASAPHSLGTIEHLTVLSGQLVVESGDATQHLGQGTTGRYPADLDHHIRNLEKTSATALLVVLAGGTP